MPPALYSNTEDELGLLGDNVQMPRVLVLNDLKKATKGNYVYPPGSGTPARPLCEIVLEHEIVLSTTQTLVAEGGKKKQGTPTEAAADDHDDGVQVELRARSSRRCKRGSRRTGHRSSTCSASTRRTTFVPKRGWRS